MPRVSLPSVLRDPPRAAARPSASPPHGRSLPPGRPHSPSPAAALKPGPRPTARDSVVSTGGSGSPETAGSAEQEPRGARRPAPSAPQLSRGTRGPAGRGGRRSGPCPSRCGLRWRVCTGPGPPPPGALGPPGLRAGRAQDSGPRSFGAARPPREEAVGREPAALRCGRRSAPASGVRRARDACARAARPPREPSPARAAGEAPPRGRVRRATAEAAPGPAHPPPAGGGCRCRVGFRSRRGLWTRAGVARGFGPPLAADAPTARPPAPSGERSADTHVRGHTAAVLPSGRRPAERKEVSWGRVVPPDPPDPCAADPASQSCTGSAGKGEHRAAVTGGGRDLQPGGGRGTRGPAAATPGARSLAAAWIPP